MVGHAAPDISKITFEEQCVKVIVELLEELNLVIIEFQSCELIPFVQRTDERVNAFGGRDADVEVDDALWSSITSLAG